MLITQGPVKRSKALLGRFSRDIIAQRVNARTPFAKHALHCNWECSILGFTLWMD